VRVAKNVKEEKSPQIIWGNKVHKAFENRVKHGTKLPEELEEHEETMQWLADKPGVIFTERRLALNTKLEQCGFFDKDCWYRGVIDYGNYHNGKALIVDYKTGKPHNKPHQLALFALTVFITKPKINLVDTRFYWTKTKDYTRKVYGRDEMSEMWDLFLPDLKQYKQAFKEEVWQPRPSGLCHGWCPVTDCEHWKPKRS